MNYDQILQASFPCVYRICAAQGAYTIPDREMMVRALQSGFCLTGARYNGILRVDMAVASLWPYAAAQFPSDHFPHRLAAAVQLLQALHFGENQPPPVAELAQELSAALDDLEHLLEAEHDAARPARPAAAAKPAPEEKA